MQNQTYESNFIFPRRMLFFHANRSALLVRGLVFFILGLIGLFRPIGSLAAVTVILGIFLLVDAMGEVLEPLPEPTPVPEDYDESIEDNPLINMFKNQLEEEPEA